MGVETKGCSEWRTQVQQAPFKEIVDFAKTHPCEYMKKVYSNICIGETKTTVLIGRKFKEIFNEH